MSVTKGVGERIAQERRLKAARDRRDVDQRDVAKAIGVTPGAVSRWESGLTVPKDEVIAKLAAYFSVTPGWLRYGNQPRQPQSDDPFASDDGGLPLPPGGPIPFDDEDEAPAKKRAVSGARKRPGKGR